MMPDVEEAWKKVSAAHSWPERLRYAAAENDLELQEYVAGEQAAVRDAMLAAYDAGALAERRYGRWRRPYMMDEKRARIQALAEGRK